MQQNTKQPLLNSKASFSPTATLPSSSKSSSKKWRPKDFLLFWSTTEGRATDKDPFLMKFLSTLHKRHEDFKNSSVWAPDTSGKVGIALHRFRSRMNKAVSKNLKKKTFLPYKEGIMDKLALNDIFYFLL